MKAETAPERNKGKKGILTTFLKIKGIYFFNREIGEESIIIGRLGRYTAT